MKKLIYLLSVAVIAISCQNKEKESEKMVFVDSVQLFEGFSMKKEYDKILENDLRKEAQLIDSINILLENASDSDAVYRLRKDYYLAEQLYNKKFEQLSVNYTKTVSDRLNEYIKLFAEEHKFQMIFSGSNGSMLYVNDTCDYTKRMIDFANKKFEN